MFFSTAVCLALLPSTLQKSPFPVTVGVVAPKLEVGAWLKGGPVKFFEKGKVYVIDSWASWCGPCRLAMPHLSELQKKYSDVVFCGVDVLEWKEDDSKRAAAELSGSVTYPLFRDKIPAGKDIMLDGAFVHNWLIEAGKYSAGIPLTFVIDRNGLIAWIGHPTQLETPLKAIVDGTWDLAKEKARYEETMRSASRTESYKVAFYRADIQKNWPEMELQVKKLLNVDPLDSADWVGKGIRGWFLDAELPDQALRFAKDVRREHVEHADVLAQMADAIFGLGPKASPELQAVAFESISTACASGSPTSFQNLVMAKGYLRRKDKDKAIACLQKAVADAKTKEDKQNAKALLDRVTGNAR